MKPALDIVILSHNVRELILACLTSIYENGGSKYGWNIIVVDNASTDGSADAIKSKFPGVKIILSDKNLGFSAGNNLARKITKGNLTLFLNPDTVIAGDAVKKCVDILANDKELGAATCKVMLPNGKLDYSCHRGLPTIWNTFTYWSGLSGIFPRSRIFSGYKATYLNPDYSHPVECISGTFLMIKRSLLDKIGWWDTDYFWNGEDIEMCYQIKKHGFKIWYEATEKIIHYKGSSSGLWKTAGRKVTKEVRYESAKHAASAMRIFMNKHKNELGPPLITDFALFGVNILEKYRLLKLKSGLKYA